MTIRQALALWFVFLLAGLMVVGILAGSWRPHSWSGYYSRMAILAFLILAVIGVFAFGYVCPRCRASLLTKSLTILNDRPCACPRCGLSVDERRDRVANPK